MKDCVHTFNGYSDTVSVGDVTLDDLDAFLPFKSCEVHHRKIEHSDRASCLDKHLDKLPPDTASAPGDEYRLR